MLKMQYEAIELNKRERDEEKTRRDKREPKMMIKVKTALTP